MTGYESIYRGLVSRLLGCDFQEAARRLGLRYVDGGIQVSFLNRDYRITVEGAEPLDGQPVNVNNRSVLLYYLLSRGSGDPENCFVLFESLPGMMGGLHTELRLMNRPLERCFRNDYAKFSEAALKLGGVAEEAWEGKHVWDFAALPKIPLRVVFYEADDEFPANIQIMLDQTALRFLEFECLAFLVGCFVHALTKAAHRGDVIG
jgi:hypothetical protein